MQGGYSKTRYENAGFYLNHTVGVSAEGSTVWYPHNTTSCLLYYFMQGSGNIKIEGKRYAVQTGDVVLLNPSELFCCTVDDDSFHERLVVHVDGEIASLLPFACDDLMAPFYEREKGVNNRLSAAIVSQCGLDGKLRELLTLLKDEQPRSKALAYCKMVEVLGILREAMQTLSEQNVGETSCENAQIARVLVYLNHHFTENLTIESVAKEFFINKSYLSHLFREYVGMPLWTYVILRRLSRFNDLVADGTTVEQACRQVGFQNYSNFFRLYKKYMNMTPSEFKAQRKTRRE